MPQNTMKRVCLRCGLANNIPLAVVQELHPPIGAVEIRMFTCPVCNPTAKCDDWYWLMKDGSKAHCLAGDPL
jgi:hypothetical protein